ncbi:nucleotidyltransferase domain-containing protein [Streptomyces murinus]|uniref:nucleotidyltransferase domain-containing protein n=1 Tax=Streptomyces murinus TaxID=33900 RepID=UPI001FC9C8CE|nr:nucleotidyltransferase domain-containing protein [Streptomyces murinus]
MRRTGAAESPPDQTGVPPERCAEVREFLDRLDHLARWAATREDNAGLLLVGSCARGAAHPDSAVDVVLLTADPAPYLTDTADSRRPRHPSCRRRGRAHAVRPAARSRRVGPALSAVTPPGWASFLHNPDGFAPGAAGNQPGARGRC